MKTVAARGPYRGVLEILYFNWRFYAATAAAAAIALAALPSLPPLARLAVILAVAPALFWLASSLLVSHYVYDRYPLYDQIAHIVGDTPKRWINLHAGLDETSERLAAAFPGAAGCVVNIFDSRVMTEASIRQAQYARRPAIPAIPANYASLPFASASFDAAFCVFAAHELRLRDQKIALFREIARILRPGGDLILVEHSRDAANFLAFGPGFLHFFSPRTWRKTAAAASLALHREFSMTPFVRGYVLRRVL